jgi:ribosomal protein L10
VLTFARKQEAVAELKEKFDRVQSMFIADYRGLDVDAVNQLRKKLRAEGQGEYEYLRLHGRPRAGYGRDRDPRDAAEPR